MNKSKYFILPIFLYLLSGTARAVDINIAITGAIYVPPCVVNNNIPIQFSFNQIMTYKVDVSNKRYHKKYSYYMYLF